MYAFHIPEHAAAVMVSRCWDLGDIFITHGASDLIEHGNVEVGLLLMRHWAGDYGLVSEDEQDQRRNTVNRVEGRRFTSLFDAGEACVKVVTQPTLRQTVVCLLRED